MSQKKPTTGTPAQPEGAVLTHSIAEGAFIPPKQDPGMLKLWAEQQAGNTVTSGSYDIPATLANDGELEGEHQIRARIKTVIQENSLHKGEALQLGREKIAEANIAVGLADTEVQKIESRINGGVEPGLQELLVQAVEQRDKLARQISGEEEAHDGLRFKDKIPVTPRTSKPGIAWAKLSFQNWFIQWGVFGVTGALEIAVVYTVIAAWLRVDNVLSELAWSSTLIVGVVLLPVLVGAEIAKRVRGGKGSLPLIIGAVLIWLALAVSLGLIRVGVMRDEQALIQQIRDRNNVASGLNAPGNALGASTQAIDAGSGFDLTTAFVVFFIAVLILALFSTWLKVRNWNPLKKDYLFAAKQAVRLREELTLANEALKDAQQHQEATMKVRDLTAENNESLLQGFDDYEQYLKVYGPELIEVYRTTVMNRLGKPEFTGALSVREGGDRS